MNQTTLTPQILNWNTVQPSTSNKTPSPRWGHSTCIVDQQFYIFGGFANSNYMNDLWVYSLTTLTWTELITQGDIPQKRSNSTLNHDPINNQLLLFGGGGPNKQRFNTVSTLDLETLNWIEIAPFESEEAPWERTYHITQFKYPYLVVFGGESADDLGDLWVYDVRNLNWQEVKNISNKPCPRRFHSSCLAGSKMYVFGGCHSKYNCLGDLYCLDLKSLLQTGNIDQLQWQNLELNGIGAERWGHTLDHYNGQLFIFGGRSNEDRNDLLSISLQTLEIKALQTCQNPQARRRHSGGFIGSALVMFGGFDGTYFDDLFYIDLFQPAKSQSSHSQCQPQREPNQYVIDANNKPFYIYATLLGKYFGNQQEFLTFLRSIDGQYFKKELKIVFETFYKGWGALPLKPLHLRHIQLVPGEEYQTSQMLINAFTQSPYLTLDQSSDSPLVHLEGYKYSKYMAMMEGHWQMNSLVVLNREHRFPCCPQLMSIFSHYFANIFSQKYNQGRQISMEFEHCDPQAFRIILYYLHTNILVVPMQSSHYLFRELATLGHYLSLNRLVEICESHLCEQITLANHKDLHSFSSTLGLDKLEELCSLRKLSQLLETSSKRQNLLLSTQELQKLDIKSQQLYQLMKFDLLHRSQEKQGSKSKGMLIEIGKENQQMSSVLSSKVNNSKRRFNL